MLIYVAGSVLPSAQLWWRDGGNNLIDFSAASAWQVKIVDKTNRTLLTKTTGVTGAAGSGVEGLGVPNVVVAWAAGELDVSPGEHTLFVRATQAGAVRYLYRPITIVRAPA
jgi:hypothetical protein